MIDGERSLASRLLADLPRVALAENWDNATIAFALSAIATLNEMELAERKKRAPAGERIH